LAACGGAGAERLPLTPRIAIAITITAMTMTTTITITATIITRITAMRPERLAIIANIVDARELAGPFSWRKVMAVVFSVGVRPCTGAILVLVFALTQGMFWAGVAATFAMALGTAITVAALASLALGSRELALRLGGANAAWANAVWTACTIGGALVIFLFGTLLFIASLGPAQPF
jgi:hypothetical protein